MEKKVIALKCCTCTCNRLTRAWMQQPERSLIGNLICIKLWNLEEGAKTQAALEECLHL